jgi:hypothetical protein
LKDSREGLEGRGATSGIAAGAGIVGGISAGRGRFPEIVRRLDRSAGVICTLDSQDLLILRFE